MENNLPVLDKSKYCRLLGKNLPTLRQHADISQEELCSRLGISRQSLSKYELGKVEMGWLCFSAIVLFFYLSDNTKNLMEAMGIIDEDLSFVLDINKKIKTKAIIKAR